LFPFLLQYFIFPKERELLTNVKVLRESVKNIIKNKIKQAEMNPLEKEKGDLMTILISDEIFKDDIEMIIDECLTFFMAGTQTTSALVGNTIG